MLYGCSGKFDEIANFFNDRETLILGSTINEQLMLFNKDTFSINVFPGFIPVYRGTMPMVPVTFQLNGSVEWMCLVDNK